MGLLNMDNLSNGTQDYMMEKKFEIMMDINNKKIAAELAKMSVSIIKLNEEIASLRQNLSRGQPIITAPSQEAMGEKTREIPSNSVRPKSNDDLKPRFGDYKPEDVPIGKFFYYGNKKVK